MRSTGRTISTGGLGVFSLALGALPLLAPRAVARTAGLSTRPGVVGLLRAVGVRELVVGAGLLAARRPAWLWARVGQDVMDVPLASVATAMKDGDDRARMTRVTVFLLAVTAVDVMAAMRETRGQRRSGERRGPMVYTAAVTVRRDEAEIRSRLTEADAPLSGDDVVLRFAVAPGGRGTEIRALLEKESAGVVGKVVEAVSGTSPEHRLSDALRRFKQLLETGEVVRSEGSPEGTSAPRTRKQRPAEPVDPEP